MEEEKYPIKALVLLDLVGDKDYSLVDYPTDFSPELTAIFKNASIETFGVNFFTQTPPDLEDDYVPFMAEKIPVIDLIDFQYGPSGLEYWHTPEDTIDKLDQRSLERTGTLVLAALPDVEKMVAKGLQVSGGGAAPGKTVNFGGPETQTELRDHDQAEVERPGPDRLELESSDVELEGSTGCLCTWGPRHPSLRSRHACFSAGTAAVDEVAPQAPAHRAGRVLCWCSHTPSGPSRRRSSLREDTLLRSGAKAGGPRRAGPA